MSYEKSCEKFQPEFNVFFPLHPRCHYPCHRCTKYCSFFSAPQGYLAEIKWLDQPADTPNSSVYQWLWINETTVTTLQFVEMVTSPRQQRTFKEALLWFDDTKGELCWNKGPTEQLVAEISKALPQPLPLLVNLHLS